jgi:hypothetical protein
VEFIDTVEFSRYDTLEWFTLQHYLQCVLFTVTCKFCALPSPFLHESRWCQNNTKQAYLPKHFCSFVFVVHMRTIWHFARPDELLFIFLKLSIPCWFFNIWDMWPKKVSFTLCWSWSHISNILFMCLCLLNVSTVCAG